MRLELVLTVGFPGLTGSYRVRKRDRNLRSSNLGLGLRAQSFLRMGLGPTYQTGHIVRGASALQLRYQRIFDPVSVWIIPWDSGGTKFGHPASKPEGSQRSSKP